MFCCNPCRGFITLTRFKPHLFATSPRMFDSSGPLSTCPRRRRLAGCPGCRIVRGQFLAGVLQAGQGLGQLARRIVGALAGRHAFYAAAGALASPRASTALA